MRGSALPLDDRGQIPGQIDVFEALAESGDALRGDLRACAASVRSLGPLETGWPGAVAGGAEGPAALTAGYWTESVRLGLGQFGVDTVKYRFRPSGEDVFDGLLRQPHRWAAGAAVLQEKPAGMSVTVHGGVVGVEGRLDPLLTGCKETFDLRPASDVRVGESVARSMIEGLAGVPLDGGRGSYCDAEIGRLDLAHEFEFEEQGDGLAFLGAVAALHPPRRKTNVWRADDGTVQTVYFRTPRAGVVRERVYDKGVESGSHAAGLRVRFESELRFAKRKAPLARSSFGGDWAARHYGGAVVGYTHTESVAVGRRQAEQQLLAAVGREELTMAKAERMLGTLTVLESFGRGAYADRQGRRRLADFRRHGVSPESAVGPDRIVPVGQLLKASMASWVADDS